MSNQQEKDSEYAQTCELYDYFSVKLSRSDWEKQMPSSEKVAGGSFLGKTSLKYISVFNSGLLQAQREIMPILAANRDRPAR
jgi:hypothetical protein